MAKKQKKLLRWGGILLAVALGIAYLVHGAKNMGNNAKSLYFEMVQALESEESFEAFASESICSQFLAMHKGGVSEVYGLVQELDEQYSISDVVDFRFGGVHVYRNGLSKTGSMEGNAIFENGSKQTVSIEMCKEEKQWKLLGFFFS